MQKACKLFFHFFLDFFERVGTADYADIMSDPD